MNVFLDFETQSTVDLKLVGGHKYISDPDTVLLSLVIKRGKFIYVFLDKSNCPPFIFNKLNFEHELLTKEVIKHVIIQRCDNVAASVFDVVKTDDTLIAHNAPFDRKCWDKFINIPGFKWFDTLPRARAAGYPGDLNRLSQIITGHEKADSRAMKMLTEVKIKAGKKVVPVGTKVLWEQLIMYNIIDVIELEMIHKHVKDYGEPAVIDVDYTINQRGFKINKSLVEKLYRLYTYNELKAKEEWDVLTDGKNPRSHVQVKDWVHSMGYNIQSFNKLNLAPFFTNPEQFEISDYDDGNLDERTQAVSEALRLRQTIVRAGRSKLERMNCLRQSESDIITEQLVYHAANTGRFGGRALQVHNFARGRRQIDVEKCLERLYKAKESKSMIKAMVAEATKASQRAVEDGELPVTVADVLNTLTRSCIVPRDRNKIFGIVDYSQIECRVTAELAGEQLLLDQFAKRLDPYKQMAAKIFGVEVTNVTKEQRQIGKIVILACGYSMSAGRFDANCRIIYNINLQAAGTSAMDCVNGFRDMYKRIAGNPRTRQGIWQRYHDAAHEAVAYGEIRRVGQVSFEYIDRTLVLTLPSGRTINYRNAFIADRVPSYCATLGLEAFTVPTLVYTHPHGYEGTLYGGLLTENIAQATARDILCDALVKLEAEGLCPVLHVHDEIVCEFNRTNQERDFRRMSQIMSTPPAWFSGLPLACEGYTAPAYVKEAFKSSIKGEYLMGKEIKKK